MSPECSCTNVVMATENLLVEASTCWCCGWCDPVARCSLIRKDHHDISSYLVVNHLINI